MLYDPAKEDVSLPALSVDLGNSPGRELQVMGQTDITLLVESWWARRRKG